MASQGMAQADLFIADAPADHGTEPSTLVDTFASPSIWFTTDPDPHWQPFPFTGSLPWSPPATSTPQYHDWLLFNRPGWIYVLVTNRGDAPSSGTERLRLYWTSSTAKPYWPSAWNDSVMPSGNPEKKYILLGEELTKPRCNAALLTDSQRAALIEAWVRLDSLFYPDSVSLWDKQDQIHRVTHVHNTANFLPWHRELVMRFELLLRSYDPTLRLPYWDWTTDPRNSYGINLFSPDFMGSAQGRCGPPFHRFDANYDCSVARSGLDFSCLNSLFCPDQPDDFRRPNYVIERAVAAGPPDSIDADAAVITSSEAAPSGDQFLWFWGGYLKNLFYSLEQNHRLAHTYLGKTMNCKHTAFQDPFTYLLHANVDKLWACWQRKPDFLHRLDPAAIYGNLSNNIYLHEPMHPWDGGSVISAPISPWLTSGACLQVKNAFDPSVVIPVTYDVAPLTIPPLQPGESVVMAYPWHVPDLMAVPSSHPDTLHLLLLARIETDTSAPYGMSVPEGPLTSRNIAANNNLAAVRLSVPLNSVGTNEPTHVGFRIHPNPATGSFTVQLAQPAPAWLLVRNLDGRLLQQHGLTGTTTLSAASLQPGIYLLQLTDTSGSRHQIAKLVVQ
ncbi:MAG: tyrosinase family protein [Chitinophagales bacterium]|nr:tyrosinase family protein [Chitinophagales bacterium]MDW8392831.1 tyrosinase family protein [Chitinophagales bacterium]